MDFESKEFDLRLKQLDSHAEQLRTIHFTLLVTVFVVVIGMFMTMRPEYSRAVEQLDTILRVLKIPRDKQPQGGGNSWNPKWLDQRLFAVYWEQLFPGLVLNRSDLDAFVGTLSQGEVYQLFGHAFTITQTPSNISVERWYANFANGPLFYASDASRKLQQSMQVVMFFYPCIHFRDLPSDSTTCRAYESINADAAFLTEPAATAYSTLKKQPASLSEFQAYWTRLNTLRIQIPAIAPNVDRFAALAVRLRPGSADKDRVVEILSCGSVRVERSKGLWRPKEAAPMGLALSSYFDGAASSDIQYVLAAQAAPCSLPPFLTMDSSLIHWNTGYYAYVDPFHAFQSKYSQREEDKWFVFMAPLTSIDWRDVNGPSLLDPRWSSLSGADFDVAFPDLAKVTTRLGDLRWNDLKTVLTDQSIKSAETVSVFGVSVPLSLLFFVGTCAIVATQIYMLAYLSKYNALARRYPAAYQAQHFPWIGLMKSLFWNISTAISVSVVPLATILGMVIKTVPSHSLFSAVIVLLEVLVCVYLLCGIRQLWTNSRVEVH